MSVRNYKELGINLQKIAKRLMANDKLMNLLYYTDKDPLSQPPLPEETKKKEIYEKLLKIIPRVGPKETSHSIIALRVVSGNTYTANSEFKKIQISIEIIVPLTQWIIKDSNLRPFAIMGEIEESLDGKSINGLGKISGGDFEINYLTEEVGAYVQDFYITQYA